MYSFVNLGLLNRQSEVSINQFRVNVDKISGLNLIYSV